jgi:hypothetical protein
MEKIHVTLHLKNDSLLQPAKCAYVDNWADIDRLKSGLIDAAITGLITNDFITGATITATLAATFDVRKFRYDGIKWIKVY